MKSNDSSTEQKFPSALEIARVYAPGIVIHYAAAIVRIKLRRHKSPRRIKATWPSRVATDQETTLFKDKTPPRIMLLLSPLPAPPLLQRCCCCFRWFSLRI